MALNPKELRFDGENGRDEFNRARVADQVIRLLTSDIDISPMVIDGAWGTGKTEFTHKLINRLQDQKPEYRTVYIDAFRADHANDPLMTILAELTTLIEDDVGKKGFLDKAVPVLRYGVKATLKATVSHVLRQNADDIAGDLEANIEQAANDAIDASVRLMLKDHEQAEKSLSALQDLLEGVAEKSPFLIFIDELDRCRPDFAVSMLEVIKHVFDVDGVKFVLVTNTSQLRASINHQYGSVVDSQRYLDKFLKFRFELPNFTKHGEYRKTYIAERFFDDLVSASDQLYDSKIHYRSTGPLNGYCKDLATRNGLSLREIKTFVRYLEIYSELKNGYKYDWHYAFEAISLLAIFISVFRPDITERIYSGVYSGADISSLFGFQSPIQEGERPTRDLIDVVGWYLCSQAKVENSYWLETKSAELTVMRSSFESMFGGFDSDERPTFENLIIAIDLLRLI